MSRPADGQLQAGDPLPEEVAAAHADLSALDLELRRHLLANEAGLRRATFGVVDHGKLLTSLIQPWPTFVGRRLVDELARASARLLRLVKSLPERWFGNDPQRLADFYHLPSPSLASQIIEPPTGFASALARGDFLRSTKGFRCVELNVTSSLGGWEAFGLAEAVLRHPIIRGFLEDRGVEVASRDTLRVVLGHVVDTALRAGRADGGELNTVIGMHKASQRIEITAAVQGAFDRCYAAALADVDPSLRGRLSFSYYPDLTADDGGLRHAGRRVHALIEGHLGKTDPSVLRAFKSRQLDLYNGPMCYVLGDKRNLALLSEGAEDGRFDAEEQRWIETYVPWTRRVSHGETSFHGRRSPMRELLVAERGELVLKKARSTGGDDVIVGRSTPADRWRELVDRCLESGDWLVQERVDSRGYLYQEGERGCSVHHAVWGPFVAGERYGGAMLRVKPRRLGDVVNSAQGASKSLLFEVDEKAASADRPHRRHG